MSEAHNVVVIGAGISGLAAARVLTSAGINARIVDAESRVGGRCATLRDGDAVYDFGAQYFTARDIRFEAQVEDWLRRDVAVEWSRGFPAADGAPRVDGRPRYRGVNGMDALALDLAAGLDVRLKTRVERLSASKRRWELWTADLNVFLADAVVMTLPAPTAMALIDAPAWGTLGVAQALMNPIRYKPTITLLVDLDGESALPEPGAIDVKGHPIDWIADNRMKGISPDRNTVTIHAVAGFSEANSETAYESIADDLIDAAQPWLGSRVTSWKIHRWPHAAPLTGATADQPCIVSADPAPIVFAGDGFGGPRIEGAYLSGLEAAQSLMQELNAR